MVRACVTEGGSDFRWSCSSTFAWLVVWPVIFCYIWLDFFCVLLFFGVPDARSLPVFALPVFVIRVRYPCSLPVFVTRVRYPCSLSVFVTRVRYPC